MPSGFLYNVGAVVDKNSFALARSELDKLEQSGSKMLKGLMGTGTAIVGMATVAGEVAKKELQVARSIDTSSQSLSNWKVACNIAGASASGLVGALSSLENKMNHLKTGSVDIGLAKNLGMLDIGYGDFADMDSESRMRTVFEQAGNMEDQKLAATLVGDILGEAGKDYYLTLQAAGKSLNSQLAEAKALNFMTERTRREAAAFSTEMRGLKEAGKSIGMYLGSEIAGAITPAVTKAKNYIIRNKEAIQKGITSSVQTIKSVFESIAGVIGKVGPVIESLIDRFGGLDRLIIKIGVGFAGMKLMSVAGNILSIVKGVNLLKAGLQGIAGLGIGLLIEDLMMYLADPEADTAIGYLVDNIDKIKEKLGFNVDSSGMTELVKGFENLKKIINSEEFQNGMKKVLDKLGEVAKILGGGLLTELSLFAKMTGQILQGDFKGAAGTGVDLLKHRLITTRDLLGGKKRKWEDLSALEQEQVRQSIDGKTITAKTYAPYISNWEEIHDGIIQPGGHVTKVDPNDWVFAMKDVGNMASAFSPFAGQNGATVTISQTFNISGAGDIPQTIKAQAYRGTSEALQQTLNRASINLQLMPGTM